MTDRRSDYRLLLEDLLFAAVAVLELKGSREVRERLLPQRLTDLADVVTQVEYKLAKWGRLEECVGQDELARVRRIAGVRRALARWEEGD